MLVAAGAVFAVLVVGAVWFARGGGSETTERTTTDQAAADQASTSARTGAPQAKAPSTTAVPPAAVEDPPPVGTTPDPSALLVLVDRERNLPDGWAPKGMVTPSTRWAPTDSTERRLLRPEAARALDQLSAAAERDGAPIIGVSAFRSQGSQQQVHDRYVATEGEADARTFSAEPGHSEHQTGLAVDVTGADGTCPTEACFGATRQAAWLAEHAPEFGFIVRYPAGKEAITTYDAEPWHLRYVGTEAAREMQQRNLTLEQYLGAA